VLEGVAAGWFGAGGGPYVVWCPVVEDIKGAGVPGRSSGGTASKARGRHGWRRSKAHEGDDAGGLRRRLTEHSSCSEHKWAARSSWA
jgi:hypothetical protein